MIIKEVKPKIWNFEVMRGKSAWKEIVYSARMSGVPPSVAGKDIFEMIIKNDYGSALEHIIIKFDLQMTKGNAPELLEHRMASHSGYSTRYIQANKGPLELRFKNQENAYEIVSPWHLIKSKKRIKSKMEIEKLKMRKVFLKEIEGSLKAYEKLIDRKIPRESARYALPFCQAVGIYHFTMNLRSVLNFLSLRLCVRASAEMRCLAAQMYFDLIKELSIVRGLVGCRGFAKGTCPEANVTGVRKGDPHPFYPICLFKNPNADIFIPTHKELKKGIRVRKFNKEKALEAQEKVFMKWAKWEGEWK